MSLSGLPDEGKVFDVGGWMGGGAPNCEGDMNRRLEPIASSGYTSSYTSSVALFVSRQKHNLPFFTLYLGFVGSKLHHTYTAVLWCSRPALTPRAPFRVLRGRLPPPLRPIFPPAPAITRAITRAITLILPSAAC